MAAGRFMTPPPLPALSSTPSTNPHADSSLSTTLIQTLKSILPTFPALVLSIGHGHGLLETLLLSDEENALEFLGVDIVHKTPQYLPEQNYRILPLSTSFAEEAGEAEAWLFIYPRILSLVCQYLDRFDGGANRENGAERKKVRAIIFIGPRADIDEFEDGWGADGGWKKEVVEENGLKGYEGFVVWRRVK
ncbi:MAG: hypothetical protein LQ350_004633 [Teloschistes chrysophthalmus]|nr:MAG: hypothetical protein LQ350_004633 [Niorma chrysophthalma]